MRPLSTVEKVGIAAAIGVGVFAVSRIVKASRTETSSPPVVAPQPPPVAKDPLVPTPKGGPGPTPPGPSPSVSNGIVATVGKDWILTNKIASGGKAANYGWHFAGATFGGQKFEASVSLPAVRVIQGIGTRHDAAHTDYSQICRLASQDVLFQGQKARLSDLLGDPVASKLLSAEGPIKVLRQPGVPVASPLNQQAQPGVTRDMVVALPNDLEKRNATILSWVEQGFAEFEWLPISTGDVTFYVMGDAMKFGGIRVNVSATLEQQIADRLDASLMTARMSDLVYAAASKIILPFPLGASPQMASTAWMVKESGLVDAALAKGVA